MILLLMFWFLEESEASYRKEFIIVHRFDLGGFVKRHRLVNVNASDYAAVLEVAYDKAMLGYKVFILPELVENDPLRDFLFRGAKNNRCPDLLVDGVFTEVKSPLPQFNDNTINNNIKYAASQANHVIIRLLNDFDPVRLRQIAKGRFMIHNELQIIEFKVKGRYIKCERNKMAKK